MSFNHGLFYTEIISDIVVISLFDGMSGGQQALNTIIGKKTTYTYFSSEVDKYAMQVTRYNYPNTIFLGDISKVTIAKYGKNKILLCEKYIIDIEKLILLAGSPCQGFSFAGKQKGASTKCKIEITSLEHYLKLKDDNFEFDGQSYLFWEFVRIKDSINTVANNYVKFLLENVKMKKKWKTILDNAVGVVPTLINSELFSAQTRPRYYWTNMSFKKDIYSLDIYLKDILENEVHEKYYLSEKAIKYINREDRIIKKLTAINGERALCLMSQYNQSKNGTFLCVDSNGRIDAYKTGTVTQRYYKGCENYGGSPFLLNSSDMRYRKFTPVECERLQTIKDNYSKYGRTEKGTDVIVSDTQRYKMIGNGWTISVIVHILTDSITKTIRHTDEKTTTTNKQRTI